MARVKLLDPFEATGRVKEVFDRVEHHYHMVPALQKGLGYLPEITDALWTLSLATIREGSIRPEVKRVFFAVTAHEVECTYCVAAHVLALLAKGWSTEECLEVLEGNASRRLSDKENLAVSFVRVAGRRPAAVTNALVEELRSAGWSDGEVTEIIASVALMRYTSTVAVALDVPLEPSMEGVVATLSA